jgi:membrane associated rhomboid family serine protease
MPDRGRIEAWAWLLLGVYFAIAGLGGHKAAAIVALLCGIQSGWYMGRPRKSARRRRKAVEVPK